MGDLQNSALGLVFRISRAFGVAPVTFTRTGMTLSRQLLICSAVFFVVINCLLLAGLVLDFKGPPDHSFRVETSASSLVWITNITNIALISAVGIFTAPCRIKCSKNVLTAINKMKRMVGDHNLKNNKNTCDKKSRVNCIFLIVTNILLVLGDICEYTEGTIKFDKEVKVLILYMGFYYGYLCFTLFACQFIVIASEVCNVLTMITNGLEELFRAVNASQSMEYHKFSTNGGLRRGRENVTSINNFVDNTPTQAIISAERLSVRVHDLAIVFGDCCDLIREVNDGFGLQLLLILMNYFLELIVTPYYLMSAINITPASQRDVSYVGLQVLWAVYHLVSLCSVVEPAYCTQLEIEKTEYLISRYLRHFKPHEPVYAELELFTRQLLFSKPSYSPMGVCTLSRQLCVTILGAVTTYLVIIVQFRANENKTSI